MNLRVIAGAGLATTLIVLPIIIVQAQSAVEGEQAADATPVEQAEVTTAAPEETDTVVVAQEEVAAEEGSVLGAEAVAGETEESQATDRTTEQAAATSTADSVGSAAAATTTTQNERVIVEAVASSTPAGDPPAVPIEEPFVLQPAVKLHVNGSSVAADISLENLTCKSCGKVLPAVGVKAYYTAWYPNDGPEMKEVGEHYAEQAISVSDVALWASRSMTWSATDVGPGRYYFVVVVDPDNANAAYRMHRTEFAI